MIIIIVIIIVAIAIISSSSTIILRGMLIMLMMKMNTTIIMSVIKIIPKISPCHVKQAQKYTHFHQRYPAPMYLSADPNVNNV